MDDYLPVIVVAAIVGGGLVTGILFAFSNFALAALADLPAEHGLHAMQRINERIQNPLFLGTPVLCLLIIVAALRIPGQPGATLLLLGALAYLAGPFAITMARNVPLNNRLAETPATDAESAWPAYRRDWQRWNHIRSYLGIGAVILLGAGAVSG